MSHKPVIPPPAERALPGRSFRLRARLVAGLFCAVCFAGLAARLAWLQLAGETWYAPARPGPAAAGYGGARRPGPDLQRRRRAAGHERHLLDHPRLPPRDAGGKAGHSRAGPGRHPRAGRGRPAGKVRPAALQRLPFALPGGPGDGRSRPGLLRPERDHRHPHQPGHPAAVPGRAFLASVLGFTNVDNAGTAGLELEYNDVLTGQSGLVLTAVNAWGYTMEQSYAVLEPPVEGSGLVLTIDAAIQRYLENALTYAVKEHSAAGRGVGIVFGRGHRRGAGNGHHPRLRPQPAPRRLRRSPAGRCGRPGWRCAGRRPPAGPAGPMAEQGGQRPVRAGQRVQAHHLRGGAGRRGRPARRHLCLRGLPVGVGHPLPLRQPQAARGADRHRSADELLQPEFHPDRRAAGQTGFLRLLCRLRPAGGHRHRPARRAGQKPLLHRRPDGPGGAGLLLH